MEFRVLGLLELSEHGRPISLPRGKERALLGVLLVHANQPISSDRLIEELWERGLPANPAKTVQIYVSRLRRRLGADRIRTTSAGYLVRTEPDELDANAFVQLAHEGRALLDGGDAEAAEARLTEALELWRGDAFADFRLDAFAQPETRRLEELRRAVVADRIGARLALGRAGDVIGELEALVGEEPLWEEPRRQLMLALYQSGRRADALALYRATRKLLDEELGLEPSSELQALERAILNRAPELDRPRPREGPTAARATTLRRGAFVGREAELAELCGGLEDALAGDGRLFLLVGEPGIGKTRLADELARRARDRGADVLVGRCWEGGGAPAYWPWVQLLRSTLTMSDPLAHPDLEPYAAVLAQLLPELRRRFPDLPEPLEPDSPAARFRLFDAVSQLLRSAAERRPLLLVLDDLHAADEPSLLLLRFLAQELGRSRIIVLAVARDVDPVPDERLSSVLADLSREPVTRRLPLKGLNERHVAEYIETAAAEIASPGLAVRLHRRTAGNPLFLAETVRLLALEHARESTASDELVIPDGVREVILRRLAHLTPACNELLALAAVLGQEFAPAALAQLAGVPEDTVLETLDEAVEARVLSDVPGSLDRLRYAHVLMRDVLYEGLTKTRRVRLHRKALDALNSYYGDGAGPHLAELAHHALAGSDPERGVLYSRQAGDYALGVLAYEEAARLYELGLSALALIPGRQPETRSELLIVLGHAQVRAGDAAGARATFARSAEVARAASLPELLAQAALGYGGRFAWGRAGDDRTLVPLLREGLALVDRRDALLRARLLGRLAAALGDEIDGSEREALSREAVALARQAGDAPTLAFTLVGRLSAVWTPRFLNERLAMATELIELAEQIGDRERAVEGHGLRFNALMELGEAEAADTELEARGRLTNEMGQPAQLWVQLVMETMRSLFRGDFEAAERTMVEAFELRRARGGPAPAAFELQRFLLRYEQGGLAEIEGALETCAEAFPNRPVLECALANLHAELGRTDAARPRLQALAADEFRRVPPNAEWLVSISFLAQTCRLLGDRDVAASLFPLLVPYADRNVNAEGEINTGAASRYLGLLAATLGDLDKALPHLEHALELNARMGARPWVAHTQHDLGEVLLERGRPDDRQRAEGLLEAALATYLELGMQPHAARLTVLLEQSARRPGAEPDPAGV